MWGAPWWSLRRRGIGSCGPEPQSLPLLAPPSLTIHQRVGTALHRAASAGTCQRAVAGRGGRGLRLACDLPGMSFPEGLETRVGSSFRDALGSTEEGPSPLPRPQSGVLQGTPPGSTPGRGGGPQRLPGLSQP